MIDDYSKTRLSHALTALRLSNQVAEQVDTHGHAYTLGWLEGIVSGVLFEIESVLRYADDDEAEES